MSGALVPIDQQNALPLYSPTSGVSGGDLTISGRTVLRFWQGPALGLDSIGSPGNWVAAQISSRILDFSGCRRFSLVCTISNGTAAPTGVNWAVYLVQTTSGMVAPVVDVTTAANFNNVAVIQMASVAVGDGAVRNCEFHAFGAPIGGGSAFFKDSAPGNFWRLIIRGIAATTSNGVAVTSQLWGSS